MDCCSQTTSCECDSCMSHSAFTSPILEVSRGSTLLVEDRNGNPKKLKKKSFALAASISNGQTELKDGSAQDPINLKFIQELLNGNAVLVKNQQGTIGVAMPVEDDTFLAYVGGVLQFVKTAPKSNTFSIDDLSSQSGKLAIIGCGINNLSELGYFTDSGDYLTSSEGDVSAKNFCDASDSEELDYIFGCSDGALKKIAPTIGKKLTINSSGKFVLSDDVTPSLTWLATKVLVGCKKLGGVTGPSFPVEDQQISVGPFSGTFDMAGGLIPGYVSGAKTAYLRGSCYSDTGPTSGGQSHAQVKLNNIVVLESWLDSATDFAFQNSSMIEVPLNADKFTYELFTYGDSTAMAKLEVVGWRA